MNLARPKLPLAPPSPSPLRRLKLWDMEKKQHCPVIGTCVSMDELTNFAKRYAFDGALNDEFALHVEAVQRSQQRNDFSVAMQKHLDRKYALALGRFEAARSDADVHRLWRDSLARGDAAAALWATVTHKRASEATRHAVYADIHMLSHQVGAGQAADCRRMGLLEREHAALNASLLHERRESAKREAEMAQRLQAQEGELADLRAIARDANEIRERLQGFESGEVFLEMSRRLHSLEHIRQQLCNETRRSDALEKSLARQRQETAAATRERELLAAEREALESLLIAEEQCAANCAQECEPTACGGPRHVLCVGGRTPLLAHYRALAQRLGIRLTHHDGGQEEALSRLPDMINGADAVLCPTDCVSHSAYYQLKHHCRRSGKPCLLFKGAGVSSFALALTRLSVGDTSLARKIQAIMD